MRGSVHVLWKEEEQAEKSISGKVDDQTPDQVREGARNQRKLLNISQLTSASWGRGGWAAGVLISKVNDHYSFIQGIFIDFFFYYYSTILLLWAMPSARCRGYSSKQLTPCPQEMCGLKRVTDSK